MVLPPRLADIWATSHASAVGSYLSSGFQSIFGDGMGHSGVFNQMVVRDSGLVAEVTILVLPLIVFSFNGKVKMPSHLDHTVSLLSAGLPFYCYLTIFRCKNSCSSLSSGKLRKR